MQVDLDVLAQYLESIDWTDYRLIKTFPYGSYYAYSMSSRSEKKPNNGITEYFNMKPVTSKLCVSQASFW